MDQTCTQTEQFHQDETRMLARVVDAMLAARGELERAAPDQWSRVLLDSCRRQKLRAAERRVPVASMC